MKHEAINIQQKLSLFEEQWKPKVIAEMNDYQFKIVKIEGDFVWHDHPETDETFIVLDGELRIDFRDGAVNIGAGEMFVVPKGLEHKPYAEKEVKIEYLSVIGNLAPMIGLLGTVTGMIIAFERVAGTQGAAGAAELAEGIYQALVTTVGGLIVAIPSLGAFAFFRNRVDQLVAEAAYLAHHTCKPLKRRLARGVAPTPPPAPRG